MIPVRGNETKRVRFMICYFKKLDSFMNVVIQKKITSDDALLLIWMASFAWKLKYDDRRPFMKSISQMAEYFDVSEQTIQRRLSRLRKAGLIRSVYRKQLKNGKFVTFNRSQESWNYKKGNIVHAFQIVVDDTFVVEPRSQRQQALDGTNLEVDDEDDLEDEFADDDDE